MRARGEKWLDEARQESEPFGNDTGLSGEREEILDNHVEALAMKPVESLEHGARTSVQPALIHVHDDEPVQQRRALVRAATGVIRHHVVGRIQLESVPSCYEARDGRFACTAPAADPVYVLEPLAQRCPMGICRG